MREPSDSPLPCGVARWSFGDGALPVFVYPMHARSDGDEAVEEAVRRCAERYLARVGSMVFRGFAATDRERFRRFASALGPLRVGAHPGVLEAPLCAPDLGACRLGDAAITSRGRATLHSEHAHGASWPAQIWAWCEHAPAVASPAIADTREVYRRVPSRVRSQLIARGIEYVRDLGAHPEHWPDLLRGRSRVQIESWCRGHGIVPSWGERGALRLIRRGRVVARHPRTGERVWFNHVHALPAADAGPGLSVRYAGGGPIEADLVAELRAAYEGAGVTIPWEAYDVLLVDNMLTAHALPAMGGRFALELSRASGSDARAPV